MSLRVRTVLILCSSLILVSALLYVVLHYYIFTAFASLERVHFDKLGHQVARTVEGYENYYDAFVRDWAIWNDSYQFVADGNSDYVEDNIDQATLESIGTRCFVYFDREFNVVYRFSAIEDSPLVDEVVDTIQRKRTVIAGADLVRQPSFYLCLEQVRSPFLAAMHPIVPTDHSQPLNGYLLMGRLVDEDFSRQVSDTVGYDFELVKDCQGQCGVYDELAVKSHIEVSSSLQNEQLAQMTLLVRDLEDVCSFKLVTELPREMNVHLKQVFTVTLAVMVVLGLLGIWLVELILNHQVLGPVSKQIQQFTGIADSGDLSCRFEEQGTGELLLLSRAANRMLGKINALNQQLHLASETDSLTGLWNRRRFDVQLRHEWQLAQRNGCKLALLMVDVDHFKQFNDFYGHQEGDSCLQTVAETIRGGLRREVDVAVRYGGEEFAVILPDVDEDGAMQVAERIRRVVQQLQIPNRGAGEEGVVTVSIGVASQQPQRNKTAEALIRQADQALYRAKNQGRNCSRVMQYPGAME